MVCSSFNFRICSRRSSTRSDCPLNSWPRSTIFWSWTATTLSSFSMARFDDSIMLATLFLWSSLNLLSSSWRVAFSDSKTWKFWAFSDKLWDSASISTNIWKKCKWNQTNSQKLGKMKEQSRKRIYLPARSSEFPKWRLPSSETGFPFASPEYCAAISGFE